MQSTGDSPAIADEKRAIRALVRNRLGGVGADRSALLQDRLLTRLSVLPSQRIACVWPLPGEADLRPLCATLHDRGWEILLPETSPKGSPLRFRCWNPDSPMLPGRFGTCHPDGEEAVPDIILVPMLAFDRRGYRLGYGGGYYDRTLASLPHAQPVGFAFSEQEVARVPVGPFDKVLPVIVTEREDIVGQL
ncbi:5-formyltetrahydrofolate cyclo-ligase [Acetobacter sp.]|uniref:5-formyltetrahydrofolate cyclo-ligase n=1 Tax=Acetobacter sp. TaxID=440 RepID=UPI0039EB8AC9